MSNGLVDEIIDIEQIEIANEINVGDFVLLETTGGTKLLDFKDFIIGVDNITFFDKVSGDYLAVSDISAISATALANRAALSSISAVGDDIQTLQTRINSLEENLVSFVDSLDVSSLQPGDISTFTTGSIGFTVRAENTVFSSGTGTANGQVYFKSAPFKGSALNEGTDIVVGDSNTRFSYTAKGSYALLLNGNLSVYNASTETMRGFPNNSRSIRILKNDSVVSTVTLPFHNVLDREGTAVSFSHWVNLSEGDKITLATDSAVQILNGEFSGIKLG